MPGTHNAKNASTKIDLLAMMRKSCHLVLLATALQAAAISSRGRPATAPNFYPAKVSRSELHLNSNRAVVRDVGQALKEDGIIAVEVPGFDELNRAVLRAAHECIDSTSTPQATLADGTLRRSLAASRSDSEAAPLDVPETCAPLAAAEAEFRAAVWSVAEAVAAWLGAIDEVEAAAPLLRTRDGAPYATVSDIVRAGDHLEHFHAYRKESASPEATIDLHTDQGLFIAFTPALTVGAEDVSAATFTIARRDGSRAEVALDAPRYASCVFVMLGDGVAQYAAGREAGLRAAPHALETVWKSTSELGYPRNIAWTFVNLHAIEPTRPRGQRRVDGVESPRHRTDAATEARRVDGLGRPKFDFHTGWAAWSSRSSSMPCCGRLYW